MTILTLVVPECAVPGIEVTIEQKNESIVADTLFESLVVDYYLWLTIISTGTHAKFPEPDYQNIAITQLIDSCTYEFEADTYTVVPLEHYRELTGIAVYHGTIEGTPGIWVIIRLHNHHTHTYEEMQALIFPEHQ